MVRKGRAVSRQAWYDASMAVLDASFPAERGEDPERRRKGLAGRRAMFGAAFKNFWDRHAGRSGEAGWDEAGQAALAGFHSRNYRQGRPLAWVTYLHEMKCLRLGYAVAAEDPAWAAPAEAAWLAGKGLVAPDWRPAREAPPAPPAGPRFGVPYGFAYEGRPKGARSKRVPLRGEGLAVVERVPESEAPVTCVLGFGDGNGSVAVRTHDGRHFRPVMAPGSRRAITEAEFLTAAGGDDAWADSAFLGDDGGVPTALRDYARLPDDAVIVDAVVRDDAERGCRTRCGRLVSVGGVVHVETTAPRLHVVETGQHAPTLGLGWRVGTLSSTYDGDAVHRSLRAEWDCRVDSPGFRVGTAPTLRAAAAAMAARASLPVAHATVEGVGPASVMPDLDDLMASFEEGAGGLDDEAAALRAGRAAMEGGDAPAGVVSALRAEADGNGPWVAGDDGVTRLSLTPGDYVAALLEAAWAARDAVPEEDEDAVAGMAP